MKKILTTIAFLALLLTAPLVQAAWLSIPTVSGDMMQYTLTWTSNAAGDYSATKGGFTGTLTQLKLIPATGASAPDTYTLTVTDGDGNPVYTQTSCPTTSASLTNYQTPLDPDSKLITLFNDQLTATIDSAGNANGGTILFRVEAYRDYR